MTIEVPDNSDPPGSLLARLSGDQLSSSTTNPVDNAPDKAVNCHFSLE
jgi:hypothetical protein